MAGVKGRSGRKAHLSDMIAKDIVKLSSNIIIQALKDETLPIVFRSELAKHFVLKSMPQVLEVDSHEEVILKLSAETILKDNNRLRNMLSNNSDIANDV